MGVTGLWEILRPAGNLRSFTHLTVVDGIWFFHAGSSQGGENPQLRTLYFRCCKLLALPVLPLFVFDGLERPDVKRKKRISKEENRLVNSMRQIVEAFGFEHWTAPGEAEAELAYLNEIHVIDGILSDDVDTFLFGAAVVIRNPQSTAIANPHQLDITEQLTEKHVVIYRSEDLESHPDIMLNRAGLILTGLLSGGDYSSGLVGCGIRTAHGLARCGFGDRLLEAVQTYDQQQLLLYLGDWREDLRRELCTDQSGILGRRSNALSKTIPDNFPDISILKAYTMPITSRTTGQSIASIQWRTKPSLAQIAHVCELFFEWGIRDTIINRFRTHLWEGALLRTLRDNALDLDKAAAFMPPGEVPATAILSDLIVKIHSERRHPSTGHLLEYRLEIDPTEFVDEAEGGITDLRKRREHGHMSQARVSGNNPPPPRSNTREWMPAVIVESAAPHFLATYRASQAAKAAKAEGPRKRRASDRTGSQHTGQGNRPLAALESATDLVSSPTKSARLSKAHSSPRKGAGSKSASIPAVPTVVLEISSDEESRPATPSVVWSEIDVIDLT